MSDLVQAWKPLDGNVNDKWFISLSHETHLKPADNLWPRNKGVCEEILVSLQ